MKRSTQRILVSHAGTVGRSPELRAMVIAKSKGEAYDAALLNSRIKSTVAEVVRQQVDNGIDIVNDGEVSKPGFSNYIRDRLGGVVERPMAPNAWFSKIWGRDNKDFEEYFKARNTPPATEAVCTGALSYIGQATVQADIDNFKAALKDVKVEEAFLPAVAPGTIEHWLRNEHYSKDEDFLSAIADACHEEYKAIVDAGFILQIDDPDLPDAWSIHPEFDFAAYRKFASLRIEALNQALKGLPADRVRFHTCWGSYHGPHMFDVPLKDIVDLILKVNAECYSIEASNPRHEHEYHVWEEVKLPAGKSLMPGVVGHCSDFVEHPELVAERLIRYAKLVGRENVIAGTDCGLGSRVGHPKIALAKFAAMAEGARLATQRLWK
jgi:5-methyltetrahydropteroyltriglutamate--homocysteine methyltransferase